MTITAANITKSGYYDSTNNKVYAGNRMTLGANIHGFYYYNSNQLYINHVKGGRMLGNDTGNTPDANGYVDATGGEWSIITHDNSAGGVFKDVSGKWIVRWTGTADVEWNMNSAVENVGESSANRKIYDVTDTVADNIKWLTVSGGTCTNLELIHGTANETRFDAGNVCSIEMVADCAGYSYSRLMGLLMANDNYIHDYADYIPYDYLSWSYRMDPTQIAANAATNNLRVTSIPIRAACQIANELTGGNLWLSSPPCATDACISAIYAEVNTYLDGDVCYIEHGNELWNFGGSFSQAAEWNVLGNVAVSHGTMTPATASVAATSHGLTTGEQIRCFNNIAHMEIPWGKGRIRYVIVDDANTFRTSPGTKTIISVTKANPAVVEVTAHGYTTGDVVRIDSGDMTEINDIDHTITEGVDANHFSLDGVDSTAYTTYTTGGIAMIDDVVDTGASLPAWVTQLSWKDIASGNALPQLNYGNRCVEVWALAKAEIGAVGKAVLAGQFGAPGRINQGVDGFFDAVGCQEKHDFYAHAPYFNAGDLTDWHLATTAEITAWMISGGARPGNDAKQADTIARLGHTRIICYEGGNEQGHEESLLPAEDQATGAAKTFEWCHSDDITTYAAEYYPLMNLWGVKSFATFLTHNVNDTDCWGTMENSGDTDAKIYLGMKDFLDNGGAPPRSE